MPCDHDHSGDELQADICNAVERFRRLHPEPIAIIAAREGPPAVGLLGNMSDFAYFAHVICEAAAQRPRPANCRGCQNAHDQLMLALKVFSNTSARKC